MLQTEDPKLRDIHNATMKVLGDTGMRFLHPEAIRILRENGMEVDGNIAYFKEEQILYWLSKAPSKFTVYARNPIYNMEVGGDTVNVLLGTGAALVGDIDGNTRIATTKDFLTFVKLYEQNGDYKSNGGGVLQAQDVDPRHRMTTAAFCSMLYSEKIIEAESIEDANSGTADGEEFMKLLQLGFGISEKELMEKPRCIAITNTNSPLLFDTKMLDMLFVCAKYRQPVCISACCMSGTTGPVTLAGNLVVTNAEVLAGVVLSQMVNPGCPVVYGCQSTISDLRTGKISIGAPESGLIYATAAKLAKMYGLPSRGGGAHTDAVGISPQSGYESMLTLMATYGAGTNLIFHSSGIMNSYAHMSYEKLMIDFEIVSMVKRFYEGIKVDEERLAVDTIMETGIGGQYLSGDHTLEHMRTDITYPLLGIRNGNPKDYRQKYEEKISERIDRLLSSYRRPVWQQEKIEKMKQYLIGVGVGEGLLNQIILDRF